MNNNIDMIKIHRVLKKMKYVFFEKLKKNIESNKLEKNQWYNFFCENIKISAHYALYVDFIAYLLNDEKNTNK